MTSARIKSLVLNGLSHPGRPSQGILLTPVPPLTASASRTLQSTHPLSPDCCSCFSVPAWILKNACLALKPNYAFFCFLFLF